MEKTINKIAEICIGYVGLVTDVFLSDVVQDADTLALVNEWKEFRVPNCDKLGAVSMTTRVFGGHKIYYSAIVTEAGFDYYVRGMGEIIAEKT